MCDSAVLYVVWKLYLSSEIRTVIFWQMSAAVRIGRLSSADPAASAFFNMLRDNSRNWTGRASIEIQLGLKLTKKLSDAHSVPDAINAYQEWLNDEIGAYAEDSRRLMCHGQKFINASFRLLSNG
jgi:hypothetical protein